MKKKVIIYLSSILLAIICTVTIVICYTKNKSNIVNCNLVYQDSEYKIKTEVEILYKDNKIINCKKVDIITSKDEDLLKFQKLQYEKEGYKLDFKKEKILATKEIKIKQKPQKLINEFLKSGYSCNK